MRANQHWVFDPPLNHENEHGSYSIKNYLTGLFLDVRDNSLMQTHNSDKLWQIRKKHGSSG